MGNSKQWPNTGAIPLSQWQGGSRKSLPAPATSLLQNYHLLKLLKPVCHIIAREKQHSLAPLIWNTILQSRSYPTSWRPATTSSWPLICMLPKEAGTGIPEEEIHSNLCLCLPKQITLNVSSILTKPSIMRKPNV